MEKVAACAEGVKEKCAVSVGENKNGQSEYWEAKLESQIQKPNWETETPFT